jgi:hypothetical protein
MATAAMEKLIYATNKGSFRCTRRLNKKNASTIAAANWKPRTILAMTFNFLFLALTRHADPPQDASHHGPSGVLLITT